MAFIHGRNTRVLLDGKDVSLWLRSADFTADNDPAETTTFTKQWKVFIPGANSATFAAEGLHDADLQDIRAALVAGADSVLTWGVGGLAALGEPARMMASLNTSYKESSPVGDVVAFNWAAQSNDDAAGGILFHPLAAETTTGTSAFVDGGGATLLGAVANLHVTARAGSSPTLVVKFSDATTSGGTYTDIAGGAFTLMNAVGGQRLVIPGTIRQFVKATWTIGGTGGPTFTFAVALARR